MKPKRITINSPEEWLQARTRGIGGSDAGAVAGLNPWKSPVDVFLEKTGVVDGPQENEAMYWGTVLEEVVAQEFAKRNGVKVRRNNAILQHAELPFMLANVDREIVGEDALLEIKTANAFSLKEWEAENIPAHYLMQCHHYLAVTGVAKIFLAVLVGGQKYLQFEIQRDEEIITYLAKIEADFWQCVEKRTPPALDDSTLTTDTMKLLYPDSSGATLTLPDEHLTLFAELDNATATRKDAEAKEDRAKARIQELMQEAEVAVCGERKATWKNQVTNRFDAKTFGAVHPALYAEFTRPSTSRVFRVK